MPHGPPKPPASFITRKASILQQLAVPATDYTDLSPKGSVDEGIRHLIDELNAYEGFVTTSSCAGRVSVFLEGSRGDVPGQGLSQQDSVPFGGDDPQERQTQAGVGGKGGGGTWLFVSHDPIDTRGVSHDDDAALRRLLGLDSVSEDLDEMMTEGCRLIHFKFEPMILHVLAASPFHAQLLLRCSLPSGFRESGALNIDGGRGGPTTPMVAVRTMGLGFSSLVGYESANGTRRAAVSASYLRTLLEIGNTRFAENAKRIDRFRTALRDAVAGPALRGTVKVGEDGIKWEDAAARRERKRAEGLRRRAELSAAGSGQHGDNRRGTNSEDEDNDILGSQILLHGI
ncbi:hypothetical protein SODALDRAFT_107491 [Sodiomyces alkalinus F11]|uniref:tRNA(Phe) 7-[(3-amino-3-carboxypropyl)-4-demethylwyosine(37)-N(4)]-methyltransferase n=1 Tax=Sodiomyces alkalinus (strain CBS 110278 / VKM F-3762 / F11) TaxID=1314773 RepID=A0A3N2Q2G0_SODAK|nr:hypothetical protein SODALDRAFT_107491 [Sodiomyces alkalinus F11]ROT40906.1 hypothetical protein SODALDRAFT_107491 [Sodiomyces alkalinus F11]